MINSQKNLKPIKSQCYSIQFNRLTIHGTLSVDKALHNDRCGVTASKILWITNISSSTRQIYNIMAGTADFWNQDKMILSLYTIFSTNYISWRTNIFLCMSWWCLMLKVKIVLTVKDVLKVIIMLDGVLYIIYTVRLNINRLWVIERF